jgi:hypothetical protein
MLKKGTIKHQIWVLGHIWCFIQDRLLVLGGEGRG